MANLSAEPPSAFRPRIVAKLEPVPKGDPVHNIDHGDYLDIETDFPEHTIAQTEHFVSDFLAGAQAPVWPVQGQ